MPKRTEISPLDYMLSIVRDAEKPDNVRFEAAKHAAPYVHPKLSTVQGDVEVAAQVVTRIELIAVKPRGDRAD